MTRIIANHPPIPLFVLVGYATCPFLLRGGYPTGNSHAGILAYNITYGHANNNDGFRSVIVL